MVSKLAKQTIELWKSEGLCPTFEDCILLNSIGLKVETGAHSSDFGYVPRCGFLDDYIFWEPTVYKSLWISEALKLIDEDDELQIIALYLFALNQDRTKFPDLGNIQKFKDVVNDFAQPIIENHTKIQLLTLIDYVLNGNDESRGEEVEPEDIAVREVPEKARLYVRQLFLQAMALKMDDNIQFDVTVPELEKMIDIAFIWKGSDVAKNEHTQAAGKFYVACGKIKTRLLKERDNGKQ